MADFASVPRWLLRVLHLPPQAAYALGLGPVLGRMVLLLTTTGRRSGQPRVTPLQYEELDDCYYLGSALGLQADWVRNIQANPRVELRVKNRRVQGCGRVVVDPCQIADFLELRLARHPRMIGRLLQAEGLRLPPSRAELEAHARRLVLVVVEPGSSKLG
jgi:deazaflavin-dependent oxidoreductase (nitroreductase family)